MSSKSTSIGDLPNVNSGENSDIDQETMMVNSILQEIENDDDIDTSENAINYAIDTSQIPPKIHEQMPTKQIIEETAKELFHEPIVHEPLKPEPQINVSQNLMEPDNQTEEIDKNEINNILSNTKDSKPTTLTNKIISISKYSAVILVLFLILTSKQVNSLIIKFLPKMRVEAPQISLLGNLLKGLILVIIYAGLSFVL